MFECVAIGDPHLDKLRGLFPEKHLQLQINELRKPFEYALEHGIKYVVLLGDIADKSRLSEEAQIALFNLLISYDGRLVIYIILGNHDVYDNGTHSLQFFVELYKKGTFKSVHIISEPTQKKIGNVAVNFLPFPATKSIKDSRGYRTVNFAHLERPGALRDNGMRIQKYHGVKQKGKDVWVIGHLHTPQTIGLTYYSGTMYQQNFGESLPKGFLHCKFKITDELRHKIKFVENDPKFKLFNHKIETESDLDKLTDDPLHRHKLFIKQGVVLPPNFAEKHPNVAYILGYKNKKTLEMLQPDETDVAEASSSFGLTDNLRSYLKTKHKPKKKMLKRAMSLIDNVIEEAKKQKLIQVE